MKRDELRAAMSALSGLESAAAHYHDEYDCGDRVTAPREAKVVREAIKQLAADNRQLTVALALKLCELGDVDDPRVPLKAVDVRSVARGLNRTAEWKSAPMTLRKARLVVAEWFSRPRR